MKSIHLFNKYGVPVLVVLVAAVAFSGCHRWHHHGHGHHGHGHAKHGGHHGRLERGHR